MIEQLACKLGRNDEVPNIELAEKLCRTMDKEGIREIVDGLRSNEQAVASDCIKVLYEAGWQKPELIADFADDFITALSSKNNRMVWGSMTALAKISEIAGKTIYENIEAVISAYEKGSTITIDNSISVFAGLCKAGEDYEKAVLPILLKHLEKCRPKEVPQHAERASVCFNKRNAGAFIEVLEKRNANLAGAGQTRVKKLLKKLYDLR